MLIWFDFLFLRSAKSTFLDHIRYSTGIWTDMIACVRRASENATNLISVIQCFVKADNTSFLWLCCSFLCCSTLVSGSVLWCLIFRFSWWASDVSWNCLKYAWHSPFKRVLFKPILILSIDTSKLCFTVRFCLNIKLCSGLWSKSDDHSCNDSKLLMSYSHF